MARSLVTPDSLFGPACPAQLRIARPLFGVVVRASDSLAADHDAVGADNPSHPPTAFSSPRAASLLTAGRFRPARRGRREASLTSAQPKTFRSGKDGRTWRRELTRMLR